MDIPTSALPTTGWPHTGTVHELSQPERCSAAARPTSDLRPAWDSYASQKPGRRYGSPQREAGQPSQSKCTTCETSQNRWGRQDFSVLTVNGCLVAAVFQSIQIIWKLGRAVPTSHDPASRRGCISYPHCLSSGLTDRPMAALSSSEAIKPWKKTDRRELLRKVDLQKAGIKIPNLPTMRARDYLLPAGGGLFPPTGPG